MTRECGHTSSHRVDVDVRAFGGGPEATRTLAAAKVLARQGFGPGAAAPIAAIIAAALRAERPSDALRAEVAGLRRAQRGG